MEQLHEQFQKKIDENLANETTTIASSQYEQCKLFSKEVIAEMIEIKERLDDLREKIKTEHDTQADKSFLKGPLSAYEKFIPEIDVDGLEKQLDKDEKICKASATRASESA